METELNTFNPLDYVNITLFGLNYQGRVLERIITASGELYLMEYAQDGDLKQGRFRGDELKGAWVRSTSAPVQLTPSGAINAMGAQEITGNANEIVESMASAFRRNLPIPRAKKKQ